MENYFDDLVVIENTSPIHGDIVITINGRKLEMLQLATKDFQSITYRTTDAESVLSYVIQVIRLAKRQRIVDSEDILCNQLYKLVHKETMSNDDVRDFIKDVNILRELMRDE